MARYYYIGPWVWRTDPEMGQYWDAPTGAIGRIDLRPYAACAQAGGSHPQNYGFFATDKPLLDLKYLLLATDIDAAIKPDIIEGVATKLKTPALKAKTVRELLVELLTVAADPDQINRTSCLMPKQNGMMEIHLGGHSVVWQRPFEGKSDPAWPNIQQVVQATYRETRERALNVLDSTPTDLHRKRLTDWQGKFGIDYTKFIPDDLPTELPAPKETAVSDDFNRDNGALGAN